MEFWAWLMVGFAAYFVIVTPLASAWGKRIKRHRDGR